MNGLIGRVFPFGENWSWLTFCLYIVIGILVTFLCKKGSEINACNLMKEKRNKEADVFYFLAFLLLVLLATLRTENVGPDTRIYVDYFQEATYYRQLLNNPKIMEQGFLIYNLIMREITSSYTVYFFVTYSFIAWAYISYMKNHFNEDSNYIFLQLFIFFYINNMSGMRSAIAQGFLLLSYTKLSKERTVQALILTLIASMFHYTTIINIYMICMVWLLKRPGWLKVKRVWILAIIATIFTSSLSVYSLQSIFMGTKYETYASISIEERSLLGSTFFILFVLLCIINYKKLAYLSEKRNSLKSPLIMSMSLAVIYPVIYIIGAYRIPNYYALPRLAVWSEINNIILTKFSNSNKQRAILQMFLQIIVIFYLLFRFTRLASDGCFKYEFIW